MTKIYVGNLPFTAYESEVRDLFAQHGTVESVALPSDRETGRPRGFGFVEMPQADAQRAMQALNGLNMGGRPLRVTDPAGSVTTTEYDLDGNAVRTVDPLGAETRFEYDGDGRLVRTLDALGRESRIVYDDEGRVLERWAPGNRRVAKAAYDEEGNPFQSWDAADHRTDTVFDELGRVRSTTVLAGTAAAATTTVAYDLTGAVLAGFVLTASVVWPLRHRLRRGKSAQSAPAPGQESHE